MHPLPKPRLSQRLGALTLAFALGVSGPLTAAPAQATPDNPARSTSPTASGATSDVNAIGSDRTGTAAAVNGPSLSKLLQGLSTVPDPLPSALRVTIDSITPNIVDSTTSNNVDVRVTLRNVGALPVNAIDIRLQRGSIIPYGNALRHALVEDQINYPLYLPFHRLDGTLRPGQTRSYTLHARITGSPKRIQRLENNRKVPQPSSSNGDNLHITRPGVYPILVNVNGRVGGGSSVRLHDARTLLPIVQLPSAAKGSANKSSAAKSTTAKPRPVTVLWPLADIPRDVAYYSYSSTPILRDDTLGASLSKDGRLRVLLDTVTALASSPNLGPSLCLAIDPDLIRTVSRMTNGYRVVDDKDQRSDANSLYTLPTRRGKYRTEATEWLNSLRLLARRTCTIALPWGGANLGDTAAALGDTPHRGLMDDSRRTVAGLLNIHLTSYVIWPSAGAVSPRDLAALDHPEVLLPSTSFNPVEPRDLSARPARPAANAGSASGSSGNGSSGSAVSTGLTYRSKSLTSPITITPYDATVATALAATGRYPINTAYSQPGTRYLLDSDSQAARMQDALATILWKTAPSMRPEPDPTADTQPLLIAPPQRWSVGEKDITAFANLLRYLSSQQLVTAQPLADTLRTNQTTNTPGKISRQANQDAYTTTRRRTDLFNIIRHGKKRIARYSNTFSQLDDDNYFYKRTRYDIYRALSDSAGDGNITSPWGLTPDIIYAARSKELTLAQPPQVRYPRAYARAIVEAGNSIDDAVTLITPGSIYTLASTDSNLILVARNNLPISVRAIVRTTNRSGSTIAPDQRIAIPAQSSVNVSIPATLDRGHSVPVTVRLLTPEQQQLGSVVEMTVRSGSISPLMGGGILAAIIVLALLMVKRVLPLIRRNPGRNTGRNTGQGRLTRKNRENRKNRKKGGTRG